MSDITSTIPFLSRMTPTTLKQLYLTSFAFVSGIIVFGGLLAPVCSGEISYKGFELDELVPQKASAYIKQYDLHIPEMIVRETLDFSVRCQGIGTRAELLIEVSRREKEVGLIPDPDIDTYMKVTLLAVGYTFYKDHGTLVALDFQYLRYQARATVEQVKQSKAVKQLSVTEAFKAVEQSSSNNPLGYGP